MWEEWRAIVGRQITTVSASFLRILSCAGVSFCGRCVVWVSLCGRMGGIGQVVGPDLSQELKCWS